MKRMYAMASVAALLMVGCGDDHGDPGTLEVKVYGEDFIEQGIPATTFIDGWAITFDKFLVSVGEVHIFADHDDPPVIDEPKHFIFDLTQDSAGSGYTLATADVPGGHYGHINFALGPSLGAEAGNASAADVQAMKDGGYAIWIEGSATKGDVTKTFAWGFTKAFDAHCHGEVEVDGGTTTIEFTFHGDHLFYDDLVEEEPNVAFDLIAQADADADGEVTSAELTALNIESQERYQVGSLDIDNLWDFLATQVTRVPHLDGEAHCDVEIRE